MSVITTIVEQTVSELLNQYVSDLDSKSLLDLKWNTLNDKTNWDKIKRKYDDQDEIDENQSNYDSGSYDNITIKTGTSIFISGLSIKRQLLQFPSQNHQATSYKPFISQQLRDLFYDARYENYTYDYYGNRIVSTVNNEVTVYIWCKSVGVWLDISSYVMSLQTQTNSQIGNFSIVLPQINCEYKDDKWVINTDDTYQNVSMIKDSVTDRGDYSRQNNFFHTAIQENDLVFIKFERLGLDVLTSDDQVTPVGKIWDMIGFVDNVSISTFAGNINVTIQGRDLKKVWVEDGSYFFVSALAQQIFVDEDSLLAKRNLLEGTSLALAGYSISFKPIDVLLKFIYNKFSNLGFIPNESLTVYGERAIKSKYQLRSTSQLRAGNEVIDQLNQDFLKENRQGIYRIIEMVFDVSVVDRIIADPGIVHDNGSIINTINKFCQMPFVEFLTDTYGDKYWFIVRKPPFDEIGYKGMIYESFVTENSQGGDFNPNSNSLLKTDSLNDIDDDKLKQSIRDKISRDQKGLVNRDSLISNMVIDIDDVDVIGEPQLTYHQEAYSWYRIVPAGYNLINQESEFKLAPAISFDEYAEVWGNKPYQTEYNYLPADFILDSDHQNNLGFAENQIFLDLQFLIQSHQYLPFTRTGTIILTGDRRIKKGLFIYLKSTKEIFYVNGVSNNRDVVGDRSNRTTTLQVSRGMRESYIKGRMIDFGGKTELVSYFTLINTSINNTANINNSSFLKNWKVNPNVFDFFLNRRQWVD